MRGHLLSGTALYAAIPWALLTVPFPSVPTRRRLSVCSSRVHSLPAQSPAHTLPGSLRPAWGPTSPVRSLCRIQLWVAMVDSRQRSCQIAETHQLHRVPPLRRRPCPSRSIVHLRSFRLMPSRSAAASSTWCSILARLFRSSFATACASTSRRASCSAASSASTGNSEQAAQQ